MFAKVRASRWIVEFEWAGQRFVGGWQGRWGCVASIFLLCGCITTSTATHTHPPTHHISAVISERRSILDKWWHFLLIQTHSHLLYAHVTVSNEINLIIMGMCDSCPHENTKNRCRWKCTGDMPGKFIVENKCHCKHCESTGERTENCSILIHIEIEI